MNFIRRFLAAWRATLRQQPDYFEGADEPGFWTTEDGLALTHFFNGSTGQKLKRRLTNYVLQSAVEATAQTGNYKYHCGKARGRAEAISVIEQHFAVPAQADNIEEAPSTEGLLESLGASN